MAYRMRKMTVTKIEEVTKAKCRIEIDQEFAFVLYKGELRMYHIREGEELDPAIYEEIVGKLLPVKEQTLYGIPASAEAFYGRLSTGCTGRSHFLCEELSLYR